MSHHAPPLQRNVVLGDYDGYVLAGTPPLSPPSIIWPNTTLGFYQYGTVLWKSLFGWLNLLFDTDDSWIIVGGDRPIFKEYLPSDTPVAPVNTSS